LYSRAFTDRFRSFKIRTLFIARNHKFFIEQQISILHELSTLLGIF